MKDVIVRHSDIYKKIDLSLDFVHITYNQFSSVAVSYILHIICVLVSISASCPVFVSVDAS